MANKSGYSGELNLKGFFGGAEFESLTTTLVQGAEQSFISQYPDGRNDAVSVRYPEPVTEDKEYEFVYSSKGQGFDYYSVTHKAVHDVLGTVKVTSKESGTQQTLTFEGEYEYNFKKYTIKGTANSKYTP